MIMTNLLNNFMTNIMNHESIEELTQICINLKNIIDNHISKFIYSIYYPELCLPIKMPNNDEDQIYKTNNYYIKNINTLIQPQVLFIISCDILFNESTKDYTDIAIIINNSNINETLDNKLNNDIINFTESYRITASSFIIHCKKAYTKLQLLNNFKYNNKYIPITAISNYNNNIAKYWNGESYSNQELNINLNNTYESNKIIFPYVNTKFLIPGIIPEKSYYFIIYSQNCELYEFYKHIEHIPKNEYLQIFNNNINLNV
jgi:hypothetical protein